MNNNLERNLVENLEEFPVIFPGGFEENHQEYRDGRTSDFDMNLSFLAYEARVSITRSFKISHATLLTFSFRVPCTTLIG